MNKINSVISFCFAIAFAGAVSACSQTRAVPLLPAENSEGLILHPEQLIEGAAESVEVSVQTVMIGHFSYIKSFRCCKLWDGEMNQ